MKQMKSSQLLIDGGNSDFDDLIPPQRPSEKIHPLSTEVFKKPKKKLLKTDLDIDLSYSELAWEFLRRNRFYQAMVDGHSKAQSVSKWGHQWDVRVPRTHGLARTKPYWETYQDGEPPSWLGLSSFAERLPTSTSMDAKAVMVELQPGQVAVVFDVAGIISGQSPWDIQAWATRERLMEMCKRDFHTTAIAGKPLHRKVLVRRLRMFDLLSLGGDWSLERASVELQYRRKRTTQLHNGKINPFQNLGKLETLTAAFDHANEAYRLVYRHEYMELLRGDKNYTLKDGQLIPDTIIFRDQDENLVEE